jgi:hypothetical protein
MVRRSWRITFAICISPEASKTEHERRIFLERKLASTRPMILINFL